MLHVLKIKTNKTKKFIGIKQIDDNYLWSSRHNPSANREWLNSTYSYFKNNNTLLPSLDIISSKIIKSYFNMFSRYMEKKINIPFIKKWKRRLKTRRLWISKGIVKHTNDKAIITLYIYNRQYNHLINILNNNYLHIKKFNKFNTFKVIYNKFSNSINFIINNKSNNIKFNTKTYINKIFISYIKLYFNRELLYFNQKQMIFFNKLKFTNNLLLPLIKLLTKIYNKKIEFNIITLKYYYLNSDIMSQILLTKIRNRKNKVIRVLNLCVNNINTPILNHINIIREPNKIIGVYNETINKFLINTEEKKNKDKVNKFLNNNFKLISENNDKQNFVLNGVKHKVISGVTIKGSGRLTKRITASRSIHKLRYTGKLKNIDSTYKGLSTVMLRGYSKSNVQYTFLKSKTRIGAFGLKGWIAGY